MEDFETYFEGHNFHFTSWNDILENENIDIKNNNTCEMVEQNVQLLPRQDVSLYGIIPKMERRSFSSCKQCKHVFNPRDVLLHKNCALKVKSQHVSHFKKKVKTKKNPVPLPPLFPTGLEGVSPLEGLNATELRPNSIFIANANELPQIIADASPTLAKPSPHPDDVGGFPLPSTHSLPMEQSPSSDNTAFNNSVDKVSSTNTQSSHAYSNNHASSKSKKRKYSKSHNREPDTSAHYDSVEDTKGPCTRSIKYSNHSSGNDSLHRNKKSPSIENGYFSQNDSQEIPTSIPLMYMPMSPVRAVTPLQIIQEGEMVCLEAPQQVLTPSDCPHQMYFTIPEQLNVKMYKSRPKLASIPLYGARKIGGAIVISKQKLISYKPTSLLNNSHRLNVLKSKNNRINLKSVSDKNITNDVKHIRLSSDVNGFIIHADVSESNEDQQNSIHDGNISLMNIK
ncbi:hypothetical protein WA026_008932 [Henosepilachna vigintioctopunctata]|uniref:Uncharacterized protein n=1 Tax=Henosepilachna vigintioctopunctata TaxID=420089 RepID=A0AAW1VBM0_9CUCU